MQIPQVGNMRHNTMKITIIVFCAEIKIKKTPLWKTQNKRKADRQAQSYGVQWYDLLWSNQHKNLKNSANTLDLSAELW